MSVLEMTVLAECAEAVVESGGVDFEIRILFLLRNID
jgi:hypothetical protein